MPHRQCFQRSTLPKLVDDHLSSGKGKEWMPTSSQVNAREKLRFKTHSDKISGGIQYWHKHKLKPSETRTRDTIKETKKVNNLSHQPKCTACGGLLSHRMSLKSIHSKFTERHSKCAFGREYCDVIGPCAECCLTEQRNAIVKKQSVEFPGLEVTPRRLVAPNLVQVMMQHSQIELGDNASELSQSHQGRSVLELPLIPVDTLRYMRREAGSSKHKRNTFITDQEPTFKKYIEIRLPKI